MCGIFGVFNNSQPVNLAEVKHLARAAESRGKDSSGLVFENTGRLVVRRRYYESTRLVQNSTDIALSRFLAGHSRLATNDIDSNQPVCRDDLIVLHNGIITNYEYLWERYGLQKTSSLDSEIIAALFRHFLQSGMPSCEASDELLSVCEGVVSAILLDTREQKIYLISNNGSLYFTIDSESTLRVSSEKFPLTSLGYDQPSQLFGFHEFDFSFESQEISLDDPKNHDLHHLLPNINLTSANESLLEYSEHDVKRCSKCILPATMPYISFDEQGVCNYCNNYTLRNVPKPPEVLEKLVFSYRRNGARDCIVPFSGGRDSCYALHLIVNELQMNPIAFTYDWGMVTDLGRRNISRMCAALGVENIIIAADIRRKRENIKKNISAWLTNPHLGMISLWTAGDKHFFKYCDQVRRETGISLNLWGVNPMETTHFKTGFLGIPPAFENKHVYNNGLLSQLNYQYQRYKQFFKTPGYFNSSIPDTLSGEYWRSINKKTDYFHIFDYWTWDEEIVDKTLRGYNWEWASDTPTSWRIGDGTAALYNYVYYTVAGFTEHDTFRSNQIREGMISREEALELVKIENRPRYQSIQWYCDSIGLNYCDVVKTVNAIPKLYSPRHAT